MRFLKKAGELEVADAMMGRRKNGLAGYSVRSLSFYTLRQS